MKELARWTSTIDHNSIHLDLINKTLPDTGLWLRETNGFRKWTSCNFSSVLILHGIRGSGKTMLTSALIEQYLTEQRASIDKPPFAYFYCARSETEQERNRPAEILRSIVRQIAMSKHSKSTHLNVLMAEHEEKRSRICAHDDVLSLTLKDCERIILAIAAKEIVTIIIDAIDEIEATTRLELQDSLLRIYTTQNHHVKIFLSMRDDAQMLLPPPLAKDCSVKIMNHHTRHDVVRFTELSLSRTSLPTMTLQLKSKLVDLLAEEAKEM
jgi:Cdc6-like AAA superfamily ATPase